MSKIKFFKFVIAFNAINFSNYLLKKKKQHFVTQICINFLN